jgi:hypothetical protein
MLRHCTFGSLCSTKGRGTSKPWTGMKASAMRDRLFFRCLANNQLTSLLAVAHHFFATGKIKLFRLHSPFSSTSHDLK